MLTSLRLSTCGEVTDAAIPALCTLNHLRHLQLSFLTELTDAGMRALSRPPAPYLLTSSLTNLTSLELSNSPKVTAPKTCQRNSHSTVSEEPCPIAECASGDGRRGGVARRLHGAP